LAGESIVNTGTTVITGDIGTSPGLSITGFPPGTVIGTINQSGAATAKSALTTAYDTLSGLTVTTDLTGQDLGGLTLTPGVYYFSTSAQLTGSLILDAQNDPNARFVFIIGSTLTTSVGASVSFTNVSTSVEGTDNGLFWTVGTSATIESNSAFAGNILAYTSITLNSGSSIASGRALAINGTVSLDNNLIDASDISGGFGATVPEPGTSALIGSSCVLLFAAWRRKIAAHSKMAA
jgi:hypothetical protein